MRILLVEDDDSVAEILYSVLTEAHYAVDVAKDGQMGWQMRSMANYDLILLDIVLPKLSGLDFCQQLRERDDDVPILLITSLDSSLEKISGLDAGADDYITKPFEVEELLARIRALLRRQHTSVVSVLAWGCLQLTPSSREVTYSSHPLHLTPKEYALLELLLRNPSQVFSRSAMLDRLWSYSDAPGEETVTSHIKGLRRKLSAVDAPDDFIQTVYGVGYRLKPLPAKEPAKESAKEPDRGSKKESEREADEKIDIELNGKVADSENKSHQASKACKQKLERAVSALWRSVKPRQLERVRQLMQFSETWRSRQLSGDERYDAYQAIHTLSGALGIFGLMQGSAIAKEIEKIIAGNAPLSSDEKTQVQAMLQSLKAAIEQFSQSDIASQSSMELERKDYPKRPLLLLIDANLEIVPELVIALWAAGLTTKVSSDVRYVKKLLVSIDRARPTEERAVGEERAAEKIFSKASKRIEAVPDVVILKFEITNMDIDLFNQLMGAAHSTAAPAMNAIVCSASNRLSDRVLIARLGSYPFLYNPTVADVVKGVQGMRSHSLNRRVLIVDDDRHSLEALRELLSKKGLHVEILEKPLDFWQRLQTSAPDLLLLDIEMPQFNGLDLCQVVRQAPGWSHLPIVFFTAHADPETVQAAIKAGGDDLVEKTLSNIDLVARLVSHISRANLQQVTDAIAASDISHPNFSH